MKEQEKDYINVFTKDGNKIKAELVSRFEALGLGEYIIYKIEDQYYAARYEFDGTNTKLNTDLNEQEKIMLNEIFYKLGVN